MVQVSALGEVSETCEIIKEIVLDVSLHPELWNNAEVRKQNSLDCVSAVDGQILDNIRQLNDSQDLEFNITMQALLSNSDDMDEIEELLFKDDSSGYRDFRN